MESSELATLLSVLARQIRSPRVDYYQVLDQVKRIAERKNDTALLRIVKNHIPDFVQMLTDLERQGKVALIRDGTNIHAVEVSSYFLDTLRSIYQTIGESPVTPFPDRGVLKMEVPPANLLVADVKQDLATLLRIRGKSEKDIVRLNFPEGIDHLYVPADMVGPRLVELSVAKLSQYVQDQNNLGYVSSKLRSMLVGSEIALTNALNDLLARPSKAAQSLFEPGEFSLKFWTQLASLVLQDLTKKKDKTREEQGYCQSSYVIGHYVVHQKGVLARAQERAADTKRLDVMLKKPPYAFSLEEVFALRDPSGVAFSKKYDRQFLVEFLQSRIQSTDPGRLPQIVRLKAVANREYFIPREFVAPLVTTKVHECGDELKRQYTGAGMEMLKNGERRGPLADDQGFRTDVQIAVQGSYPLLEALLNADLLFLAKEEIESQSPIRREIEGFFYAPRKLKPFELVLGLDRRKILQDAGALLPAWYTTPVVKNVFFLFRRILGKGRKRETQKVESWANELRDASGDKGASRTTSGSGDLGAKELAAGSASASAAYKARIKNLVKEFVGSEKQIDGSLEELAERWNPLVDPIAKRNLVADVDSFIRDFIRSLRKGLRIKPPDAARIRNLARELAQKPQLQQIRRQEELQRYVEIYMIRLLLRR